MNFKYINFGKSVAFVFTLALAFFTMWSCDDDIAPIRPDTRLDGRDGIEIVPYNPITGETYTQDEINELDYNPAEQEFFTPSQGVVVNIWTQIKPLRIEIEKEGEGTVLTTLESFNESNEGFIATWNASIDELGILEGGGVNYLFFVIYDDANVDGFPFASEQSLKFKVNHVSASANALTFLRTSIGNSEILGFSGPVTGLDSDERFGAFAEFNGASNLVRLSETENSLDFTHNEDFSISLWVNTTDNISDPSMIGDKDWGGGSNKGFVLAHRGSDWKVNAGDGSNRVDVSGGNINDGQWHHLSVTFDRDSDMIVYQDGVEVGRTNMSAVGDMDSGMPITLAQDGTGTYGDWFKGKIGGVVISNYVLSPGEVEIQALTDGLQLRKSDGVSVLPVTSNAGAIEYEDGQLISVFAEPEFATVNESSNQLSFTHTQDFSVAIWVNTAATNSDPSIIGDKNWGSGNNKGFVFAFIGSNWKVNIGDGEGNRADASSGGPAINDEAWHLIAATFDRDGDMVLYQDGTEVGRVGIAAVGDMDSDMPVRITQDGTGTYGDDLAAKIGSSYIFDKVLSAEEITALFTE